MPNTPGIMPRLSTHIAHKLSEVKDEVRLVRDEGELEGEVDHPTSEAACARGRCIRLAIDCDVTANAENRATPSASARPP